MSAWPSISFGDVCDLVNGKAFKPQDWSTEGIPIVRIQNLNGDDRPFNYWAGPLDRQVPIKSGDLLLAWSGTPGTSFGAHIWNGPSAILNQHIFRCDIDRKRLQPEWARFVVNMQLNRLIHLSHGGVGLKHVTKGTVEELKIPIPTIFEQKRIAEILDRAEALRAKRRAAFAQLDTLTQAIFVELFGDPKTNPKRWPIRCLGELAENEDAKRIPVKASDRHSRKGQYPYYGASGIIDWVDDFIFDGERLLIGEDGANLVARSTPIAFPASGRFWVNNHAHVLAFNGNARLSYLEYFLGATELGPYISGTAQPKLNRSNLDRIPIFATPLDTQDEFARRAAAVEKLKAAHRRSLAELDALFASLQYRAFRGEL